MQKLPEKVVGDLTRLKQILINLIKNAFKFTTKGEIRVIMAIDEINKMLKVSIVDTGKGVKQEEMD